MSLKYMCGMVKDMESELSDTKLVIIRDKELIDRR